MSTRVAAGRHRGTRRTDRLRLDQRVLNRLVLGLNAAVAFRRRRDVPIYGESAAVWQARRVTGRDCLHRERRMLLSRRLQLDPNMPREPLKLL